MIEIWNLMFHLLQTKLHFVSPWWKIEQCLRSNDSHVAKLILILLSRRRLILFEKASIESLKILDQGIFYFHFLRNFCVFIKIVVL